MKNDDTKLIQRVLLAGDDNAFSVLVRKYQKQVHALAWRKIGDFHIAEEITQDYLSEGIQDVKLLKSCWRNSKRVNGRSSRSTTSVRCRVQRLARS